MIVMQVHEVTDTTIYGAAFGILLLELIHYFVQKGANEEFRKAITKSVDELKQDMKEMKDTIAERILPRQEYENRHKDLQNRVENLEHTAFLRARGRERPIEG